MSLDPLVPIIAIVDDERVIADTAAIILTRSGYPTIAGYSGEEAVEIARRYRPKLILINVGMWNTSMDGMQAAGRELPDVNVRMHTGSVANGEYAIEHGFQLISKPFPPQELFELTKELGIEPAIP